MTTISIQNQGDRLFSLHDHRNQPGMALLGNGGQCYPFDATKCDTLTQKIFAFIGSFFGWGTVLEVKTSPTESKYFWTSSTNETKKFFNRAAAATTQCALWNVGWFFSQISSVA